MATKQEITVVYDEINMHRIPADWIKYVFYCSKNDIDDDDDDDDDDGDNLFLKSV